MADNTCPNSERFDEDTIEGNFHNETADEETSDGNTSIKTTSNETLSDDESTSGEGILLKQNLEQTVEEGATSDDKTLNGKPANQTKLSFDRPTQNPEPYEILNTCNAIFDENIPLLEMVCINCSISSNVTCVCCSNDACTRLLSPGCVLQDVLIKLEQENQDTERDEANFTSEPEICSPQNSEDGNFNLASNDKSLTSRSDKSSFTSNSKVYWISELEYDKDENQYLDTEEQSSTLAFLSEQDSEHENLELLLSNSTSESENNSWISVSESNWICELENEGEEHQYLETEERNFTPDTELFSERNVQNGNWKQEFNKENLTSESVWRSIPELYWNLQSENEATGNSRTEPVIAPNISSTSSQSQEQSDSELINLENLSSKSKLCLSTKSDDGRGFELTLSDSATNSNERFSAELGSESDETPSESESELMLYLPSESRLRFRVPDPEPEYISPIQEYSASDPNPHCNYIEQQEIHVQGCRCDNCSRREGTLLLCKYFPIILNRF